MIQTIKRQQAIEEYPILPLFSFHDDGNPYPDDAFYFNAVSTSTSARWFPTHLARALVALLTKLQVTELIVLGENSTSWLSQINDHPPALRATNYLSASGIGKRFNGAIKVPAADWPEFLLHLYWLGRCNARLPLFHFTDTDQRIVINICQYGGLHCYTLKQATARKCKQLIATCGLKLLDGEKCYEYGPGSSRVKGRRIVV